MMARVLAVAAVVLLACDLALVVDYPWFVVGEFAFIVLAAAAGWTIIERGGCP